MPNSPSAAAALYPNLKSDEPPNQAQRAQSSLAGAMYPSLTPQAKRWDAWRERDRQALLKALREVNQRSAEAQALKAMTEDKPK